MNISQRLLTAINTIQTARTKLAHTSSIITGLKEGTGMNGSSSTNDPSTNNFENNANSSGRSAPTSGLKAESMLDCPTELNEGTIPEGFKPYEGNPDVFHCGYDGIKEDRTPTVQIPQNECFYDDDGNLVDETHEYADCGGSPNQYDAGTNPIAHTFLDDGGIVGAGWDGFTESVEHTIDSAVDAVSETVDNAVDSISETVDNVTDSISETVDNVIDSISDFFGGN